MKKILLIGWFSLLMQGAWAKDFGTLAETFEIAEPDLVESITLKLKTLEEKGGLEEHHLKIQARLKEQIEHPKSVPDLVRTHEARVFYYDPSLKVPYDLRDHEGHIFMSAGTVINPLAKHPLKKPLLLIAGDDPKQVAWALGQDGKIILVSGSPVALMKKHAIRFYFDQGGRLVRKWGIRQVPARITQDHQQLKIEECVLEDAPSEGESP